MEDLLNDWGLTLAVFLPAGGRGGDDGHPQGRGDAPQGGRPRSPAWSSFAIGIALLANFDYDRAGELQFVRRQEWIDVINSRYIVGIDGISLPLLLLTLLIVPLCIIYRGTTSPSRTTPRRS